MARPAKDEKRDRQINIKLTGQEHEWACTRAEAAGMRPAEFGRAQLLADRPIPARRNAEAGHLDPLFIAQLKRVGANLNQIARSLHLLRLPAPGELEALLRDIREMIGKVRNYGP